MSNVYLTLVCLTLKATIMCSMLFPFMTCCIHHFKQYCRCFLWLFFIGMWKLTWCGTEACKNYVAKIFL